jgi:Zn-dependent protease/predicted transcriptional regulator
VKWSLPIGRLLGVSVRLHVTFLLLLAFVAFDAWRRTGAPQAVTQALLFYVSLFVCVLLHEFGHILAARRYGIGTRDVTLLPIGGVARLESTGETPRQELVIALAGPAVNVVIAALLGGFLWWRHISAYVVEPLSVQGHPALQLLVVNAALVVFNLLPAFPMDGGRVLRALLTYRLGRVRATRIAARVGQGMAVLFAVGGLFYLKNPMLLFIALFVWLGASQEAQAVETSSALARVPVRAAMLTEFRRLAPFDALGDVSRLLLAGSQQDFPVVGQGELLGVLRREDLLRGLQERGPDGLVREAMQEEFLTAEPDAELEDVLRRLQGDETCCTTIPVVRRGELVGLVTAENVGEYLMVNAALQGRVPPRPA